MKVIQNKLIHIEPPRSTKPHIPQCIRCQQYGHTHKYCNKPFNCVKCGGHHNSDTCIKPRGSPAKCALCGGPHPANYKGCEQYHNILKGYNPHRLASINRPYHHHKYNFPIHLLTAHRIHNNNHNYDAAMRKWSTTPLHMPTNKPPSSKPS